MHELSICYALVDQVKLVADDNHATNIHSINVGIGPLSGVESHLLQQAWPIACAGTLAENASLLIEQLPVRVQCNSCGQQSDAKTNRLICAHCGDWQTNLVSGDELLLLSVELDKTDNLSASTKHSQQEASHV